jgi:cytochrome c oxidase cbb3-type subunit I/II
MTNQFTPLMLLVLENYDAVNDNYTGDPNLGVAWADIFDIGKANFTQRCLACHGCSGNSQGPYARHVVTQPANLHERIASFPGDAYHIWRVSEGVPGTAMPAWHLSLNETEIQMIAIYEMSFVFGSARTISGDISDAEGDNFAQTVLNTPPISGTMEDFETGKSIFTLYCAQCHGNDGQGDGSASIATLGGYISPVPANFTESGHDFQYYGRYVWKVTEGVETTNMPPWKWALTNDEIYRVIFYVQAFSTPDDYNTKWGPQYTDPFAQNLKKGAATSSMIADPVTLVSVLAGLLLWDVLHRQIMRLVRAVKLQALARMYALRRRFAWMWTC